MSKGRTDCFSEEVLRICGEERWQVSLQMLINKIICMRSAIDCFLRSPQLKKPFFNISDPLLLRQQSTNKGRFHVDKRRAKRTKSLVTEIELGNEALILKMKLVEI